MNAHEEEFFVRFHMLFKIQYIGSVVVQYAGKLGNYTSLIWAVNV